MVVTALDMFAANYQFNDVEKAEKTYNALPHQSKHYYEGEAAHLNDFLKLRQEREQEDGKHREHSGRSQG